MFKLLTILSIVFCISLCRNYPIYKQCDPLWKSQQCGFSSNNICYDGSLLTSVSMGLKGAGNNFSNPSYLNLWLKNNNGWINGDHFVWNSINTIGMVFKGFINKNQIKTNLDIGNIVIISMWGQMHHVLAISINKTGDTVTVHDPLYDVTTYLLADLDYQNHGVYQVSKKMHNNILKQFTDN